MENNNNPLKSNFLSWKYNKHLDKNGYKIDTYISENKQILKSTETCSCGLTYQEYWFRLHKKCSNCLKVDQLKKNKAEQELKIKNLETSLEEYKQTLNNERKILSDKNSKIFSLEASVNSEKKATFTLNHRLNERDETITNLKKRLADFEAKEKANEEMNQSIGQINIHRNLDSEIEDHCSIEDSRSESNYSIYSLVEESQ